MGRPKHKVWELFRVEVETNTAKRYPDVACVRCNEVIVNAIPCRNMVKHVLGCTKYTDEEKQQWRADTPKNQSRRERGGRSPRVVEGSPTLSAVTKRLFVTPTTTRSSKKTKTTPRMTDGQRLEQIATAFYAAGISFRVVEVPEFKVMLGEPAPNRDQLASTLLDTVYEREKLRVLECLATVNQLTVVTDGWSNPNNQHIVNYMLTNPAIKPIFWKSVNTKDERQDAEYIAAEIGKIIDEIDNACGNKVVCAVLTDNARNMRAAWEILESKYKGLICNGCAAHVMNLLMKDFFKLDFFQMFSTKSS